MEDAPITFLDALAHDKCLRKIVTKCRSINQNASGEVMASGVCLGSGIGSALIFYYLVKTN